MGRLPISPASERLPSRGTGGATTSFDCGRGRSSYGPIRLPFRSSQRGSWAESAV